MPSAIAPYIVVRPLGRGSWSNVLEIRHQENSRRYALKWLRRRDETGMRRLRDLLPRLRAVRHENVVAVHDLLVVEGQPALVIDLVEGPTLQHVLAEGPFTPEQADHLGFGLLRGLRAIHEAGVLHGDLKPSNVLLSVRASGPVVQVADYGLAPLFGAKGSSSYRAPEQHDPAAQIDERADVFAAGAVLYELLTGVRAFSGADPEETALRIAAGQYTPVTERVEDLAEWHATAIRRALKVDLDQRAQTVGELLAVWEGRGEEGTGRVAPTRAWDDVSVARLRELWENRVPVEITLDDFLVTPLPAVSRRGTWIVTAVLLLALGFLAFLVAWLG